MFQLIYHPVCVCLLHRKPCLGKDHPTSDARKAIEVLFRLPNEALQRMLMEVFESLSTLPPPPPPGSAVPEAPLDLLRC